MTLLVGVLVASVLGSVHCGVMCSAFACIANGGSQRGAWYHGGRLLAYVTLGMIAGSVGQGLNASGTVLQVQHAAAIVTGASLIAWGAYQWQRASISARPGHTSSMVWGGVLAAQLARTTTWDPRARATAIGVTTGLLPCGWLWAFIATAMGTGTPLRAAAVMLVFWIGTVPILLVAVAGAQRLGPLARIRWPRASAALVIALGCGALVTHLRMPHLVRDTTATHPHAVMTR
jgi:uncharacterized protein